MYVCTAVTVRKGARETRAKVTGITGSLRRIDQTDVRRFVLTVYEDKSGLTADKRLTSIITIHRLSPFISFRKRCVFNRYHCPLGHITTQCRIIDWLPVPKSDKVASTQTVFHTPLPTLGSTARFLSTRSIWVGATLFGSSRLKTIRSNEPFVHGAYTQTKDGRALRIGKEAGKQNDRNCGLILWVIRNPDRAKCERPVARGKDHRLILMKSYKTLWECIVVSDKT